MVFGSSWAGLLALIVGKLFFEIQALLNAMWKVMQVLLCLVAVVSGLRPEFLCCKTWIPVGQGNGPQFMHAHC